MTRTTSPARTPVVRLSLLLLLSAAPAAAAVTPSTAPATLSGTVADMSGDGLEGAQVLVVELERMVLTGVGGDFSIPGLSAGSYTLEVRHFGYATRVLPVEVPAAAPIQVTLEKTVFPLEPVNVTIARGPLSPGASPLPASVLGPQELERDRGVSLARTIETLAGVRNLSTGQEVGKPIIRGLSGARVLVLDQGMRLEDYSWSDEDGPAVDAAMADRIEVVRGPASVLYGADAVGGVVNVIPRALPDAAGGPGFTNASAELSFASNNKEAGGVVRAEGASGAWGWRLMGDGRFAEALHTPVGELENTGFGAFNAQAALVRRGDWGSVTTRFAHNGGEFKLLEEDAPGAANGVEEGGPERKLMDDRLQLRGNFPLGGSKRLETRVQGQRHNIIELEDLPNADPAAPKVEVEAFNLTLTTGLGEVLLHHSLAPGTSGTAGVTGKLQGSTTAGEIPVIPGAHVTAGGAFVLERLERGPLTVLAGLRSDLVAVDADNHSQRAFQAFTWSGGASWKLVDGLSLNGNVGTAWRAPTLFELYADGPRLGELRYEIGRNDLDKERSLNLDGGFRLRTTRVRGEVSAYRNDFRNFLYIQPTNRTQDGYDVYEYRQADAVLQGGEASVEVEAAPWLTLSGRSDYVRGTNQTTDEPLPLMPPLRAVAGAEVHGAWPSPGAWGYFGAEVEHVAAPDRLNPLDYAEGVSAYTLVHLDAGVRGTWMGRESSVSLRVRNATSTEYKDFLSRYKRFALNPGRDVLLRLRMAF